MQYNDDPGVEEMLNSYSWRITALLRWLHSRIFWRIVKLPAKQLQSSDGTPHSSDGTEEMLNSYSWRITALLRWLHSRIFWWIVKLPAKQPRSSDGPDAPFNALGQEVRSDAAGNEGPVETAPPSPEINVKDLLGKRFYHARPIDYIRINRDEFRFNVVTDSLKKESFFGGVATSLILSTLFCNKYNVPLRLITRTTENNPRDYEGFLKFAKIPRPRRVEFFSDYDSNNGRNHFSLEVSDRDIFLSTSWWSSEAVKTVNLRDRFFYILQEVEPFFYPNGDDQYRCANILKDQNIHYIVNSKLLCQYYANAGMDTITKNGICFEPAFPPHIYSPGTSSFSSKPKRKLFFYARPNNPRNLFFAGLKLLDEALLSGVIDADEWDIYFAGADVPAVVFSGGVKPVLLGHMDVGEYVEFLRTVDLGFCLMYTPHPSYPPLEVAASGGVVLTNKYMNKRELDYSKNIICADLDSESMLKGFREAVDLSKDVALRQKNYFDNKMETDWGRSLGHVLEYMHDRK